jgi:hypothetical protein
MTKRTALLPIYVIVGATAITVPVYAEEDDCSHFSWNVSHELAVMKQKPESVSAATTPGSQLPLLKVDHVYELKLSPQAGISFSAPPVKPTLNDSAQGGLARLRVPKAGVYRISISSGHWIDVVSGQQIIKSKDFQGSRGCERPHKIVEFELPANTDLVIQFSGSTETSVAAAITPVRVEAH